jgi:acid stress chaperone HdeB
LFRLETIGIVSLARSSLDPAPGPIGSPPTYRKLPMKTLAALLVGSCLLGGGPLRAEVIDFSKVTCKEFFDTHKSDVSLILAWLDGFSREENAPPILDTNAMAAGAKKFAAYCATHPAVSLETAADEVFSN